MITIHYKVYAVAINCNLNGPWSVDLLSKVLIENTYMSLTRDSKAEFTGAPKPRWACLYGAIEKLNQYEVSAVKFKQQ